MVVRIPLVSSLIRYFRIFWSFAGRGLLILIAISVLAGITEGFGLTLFMPLLVQTRIAGESNDTLTVFFDRLFAAFGVDPSIPLLFGLMALVFTGKGLIHFLQGSYRAALTARINSDVRVRTIRAVGDVRYDYYLNRETGFFSNLITLEAARAVAAFEYYCSLLISLMTIMVYGTFSLWINWQFTVATVVFGSATLYLFKTVSTRTRRFSFERSREYSRLHGLLIQSLQSFKYMKATAGFRILQHKLYASVNALSRIHYKTLVCATIVSAVAEPLVVMFVIGLMCYQLYYVQAGLAPIVVSLLFFYRIITKIMDFQKQWQLFAQFIGSVETVTGAEHDIIRYREPVAAGQPATFSRNITFDAVSFAYGASPVLSDIDLEIRKNTTVALVGASGAGKTTLVDIITGILRPERGRVLIDDRALPDIDHAAWRPRIGYVTQEPVLFNDTVANNICLWTGDPREPATAERVRSAARRAHCDQFIQGLPDRYDTVIGDRGTKLSGGQRQRIAIARELFKNPELLILDEATSSLDSESEIAIQRSIEELKGTLTVILIAHRLSTLRNADSIYVLADGRIVEHGHINDLLRQEQSAFKKMWDLQTAARHS
jgi:subfamily B ATP-binding cassette protein MsbA